jgi:hypothetical protein
MNKVGVSLYKLGELFGEISEKSIQFNNKINTDKTRLLDNIYVQLNKTFMIWGDQTIKKISFLKENLTNFFRYEKNFNEELKRVKKKNENPKILITF